MSLITAINTTLTITKLTYNIAMLIYNSEKLYSELQGIAKRLSTDLDIVNGTLEQLQAIAQRLTVPDQTALLKIINSLNPVINDVHTVLEEVQRDRNFIKRLFMSKDEFQRQLHVITEQLNHSIGHVQRTAYIATQIQVTRRKFLDSRKTFRNIPEKELSFYDFSITKNTPHTILNIAFEQFDATKSLYYMKATNEKIFLSYQLRTWSALNPIQIVLAKRRREFAIEFGNNRSLPDLTAGNSSLNSLSSTHSLSKSAANDTREKLDFSEFFMAHDDICGMTLTQSFIYIATKYQIAIVSLSKQKLIAQYAIEGDGPNTFKNISYIYIPPNDETSLYIVDRGQCAVHLYKIDDSGLRFEYKSRYDVIAFIERCNLISCAIYNQNLYVSDDANNCLHLFHLHRERQAFVLSDDCITPISPRSLCTNREYLYVADCSTGSPGILVFDEDCQPVDWFHNSSLREILAIHIDPNINELYVLTTTTIIENGKQKKRPLIVSMNVLSTKKHCVQNNV
jgi:hypothetical protein